MSSYKPPWPELRRPGSTPRHARGARDDVSVPGRGIWLAIVDELVDRAYGATFNVDQSPLDGDSIVIVLEDHAA
jgi:hypothetical protein